MNAERDSFYRVLGLEPGVSPAEIKAAYRRLVKLYHPDQDQSLDAEVKYREIRVAYETLRDWDLADGTSKSSPTDYGSPERTTQSSRGWRAERKTWASKDWTSEQATWIFEDLAMEYDVSSKRIHFELKRLFSMRLFVSLLGSVPLLFLVGWAVYIICGVVLFFAAFYLSFTLEKSALIGDNTVGRIFFWFLFTISTGLNLFVNSCSAMWYFFSILFCIIGLTMPVDFLMKDPRSPSQW